jgi:uncharacterized protein (DUF924 family)
MSLASQGEILDFWFKETSPERWFAADAPFDAMVRARFEETWRAGAEGAFSSWADTMRGALAVIVLFDQFPRNMFRGSAAAFSTDELAQIAARKAIASGFDVEAPVSVRSFFYLPLMHCEDVLDQQECVRLTRARLGEKHFSYTYALRHCQTIVRFGRFPARNAALERTSTVEEIEFLEENPNGF